MTSALMNLNQMMMRRSKKINRDFFEILSFLNCFDYYHFYFFFIFFFP